MAVYRVPGARVRRVAYVPRLDVAIRARPILMFTAARKARPPIFTENARGDRTTSKFLLSAVDSSSFTAQTANGNFPDTEIRDDPRG